MAQAISLGLLLLLVLLHPGSLWAQPIQAVIESEPSGARVVDSYSNFLGRTGARIEIDPSAYGTVVEVTLSLPGYDSKTERITVRELRAHGRYPREGAIALRPRFWWVPVRRWIQDNPLWLAGAASLVVLLGGRSIRRLRSLRRKLEEAERLERMRRESGLSPDDPLLLAQLGDYRILDRLGRGGMATVYKAVPTGDLDEGRTVAIKVLHEETAGDPEFTERFRREVNIWRTLSHPNVVSLLDWGEQSGRTYLVMELVPGKTLRERLPRRGMPPEQALELLAPVFDAVHYANSHGVTHRDLKPENVMVTPSGKVMVMDFGLARAADGDRLTRTGTFLGTPAYMAPEQIRNGTLDPRTDQYALGTVLYEMLSGRTPFRGSDPVQLLFEQVSSQAPPLENVRPEIAAVVARMLSKRPEDRYPDLAAAATALKAAIQI
ncbi:MAG: protein kinase [Armatimonadetes bacterium]|nr:protein kinase [Armatimonadota bacterium]